MGTNGEVELWVWRKDQVRSRIRSVVVLVGIQEGVKQGLYESVVWSTSPQPRNRVVKALNHDDAEIDK